MNIIDINTDKRVIDIKSTNSKYTHEEKIKYLEDAIRNGGYYGDNGTWNSIVVFSGDNHIYRVRVETLIIKNDNSIFLKFLNKNNIKNKRTYLVPGGSTEKDISNIDQAINECKEEARINVRNIQSTGITYKETVNPPKWAVESQPVNWNGNYTEVYVAEYDKMYKGHIDKVDEDKFMASGKFYNIDKVYKYLRKEHKKALNIIYPNRFNTKENIIKESYKMTKEDILNNALKILLDAGYTPRVSKGSRDAFLNNTRYLITDGSTICISGLTNSENQKASNLINNKLKNAGVRCYADNYGTIFLSVGSKIITEKALSTRERNNLDYIEFGIPSLRKFPLNDRKHVIQAIRFFNTVDRDHERELAINIIKAMKKYNIEFYIIGELNRLNSYYFLYLEDL